MNTKLKEKLNESLSAVLPITLIVLVISVTLAPMDVGTAAMFLVGAVMLVVGMGFFQLGAEMSMTPMGEGFGAQLSMTKKIWIVAVISLFMGVIITIAEPDLAVLAGQVPSIPNMVIVLTVAIGVGVFLVIAILRIVYKISLNVLLFIFYIALFVVSAFTPGEFLAVAFDSGGVTTGPITVPFIMAMGVGLASVRSDKDASSDSFGLVALCSVGPILAMMLLGIFYNTDQASYTHVVVAQVTTTRDVISEFARNLPVYSSEVLMAILPIVAVFIIFQAVSRRYKRRQIFRMAVGFVYTFIGLVLFLTGVNVGFISVGHLFGQSLAATNYKWILVPLGMLVGYFIVAAEPAVHVLNKQVEEVTNGAISHKAMNLCLSIGVSVSVGLAMVRVLTGLSIYWIVIPGYVISLALSFIVPKLFVGIAFDSGGVASGPMTTTFLLPFAMGASEASGGNVMTDAFGIVALVAMTPLIAIQIMGLSYKIKLHKVQEAVTAAPADKMLMEDMGEIVDLADDEFMSDEPEPDGDNEIPENDDFGKETEKEETANG